MIVEFSHSVGLRPFGMLAGLGGKRFKTARLGDIRVGLARNSTTADKNKIGITLAQGPKPDSQAYPGSPAFQLRDAHGLLVASYPQTC